MTARFCQLDTGDSDACDILRSKLRITSDSSGGQRQRRRERDQQQQQRRKGYGQDTDEKSPEEEFFCDICKTDRCNGAAAVTLTSSVSLGLLLLLLLTRPLRCWSDDRRTIDGDGWRHWLHLGWVNVNVYRLPFVNIRVATERHRNQKITALKPYLPRTPPQNPTTTKVLDM